MMIKMKILHTTAAIALLCSTFGCKQLPGTDEQQGAVIGGASGAVAGAVIGGDKHRVLGALLGGAVGATGGYLIGANADKIKNNDRSGAIEANRKAQAKPATAQEALNSTSADVNSDGYVTLDEVVAMGAAGLQDDVILQRLRATGQIFELTEDQKRYLMDRGVSRVVVNQMVDLNREQKPQVLGSDSQVIGRDPVRP